MTTGSAVTVPAPRSSRSEAATVLPYSAGGEAVRGQPDGDRLGGRRRRVLGEAPAPAGDRPPRRPPQVSRGAGGRHPTEPSMARPWPSSTVSIRRGRGSRAREPGDRRSRRVDRRPPAGARHRRPPARVGRKGASRRHRARRLKASAAERRDPGADRRAADTGHRAGVARSRRTSPPRPRP